MDSTGDVAPLAVVTGAAHRLGKAIAFELAQCGYVIGLHYHRSVLAAQETADQLKQAGAAVELMQADLRDPAEVEKLFQHLDTMPYRLKVWVNSASVMERGDLRTLTVADWDATLALNLRAPWLCAREAAGRMKDGGVIINLTDSGARKTWTGFAAYAVSKAGLETLTRLLAKTLAPRVRVNGVAPGFILPAKDQDEAEWVRLVERLPLRQAGSPADVAQTVRFLVENQYITGETIVVDGGYQLV